MLRRSMSRIDRGTVGTRPAGPLCRNRGFQVRDDDVSWISTVKIEKAEDAPLMMKLVTLELGNGAYQHRVSALGPDGPAAKSGLEIGDIVNSVNTKMAAFLDHAEVRRNFDIVSMSFWGPSLKPCSATCAAPRGVMCSPLVSGVSPLLDANRRLQSARINNESLTIIYYFPGARRD